MFCRYRGADGSREIVGANSFQKQSQLFLEAETCLIFQAGDLSVDPIRRHLRHHESRSCRAWAFSPRIGWNNRNSQ
jgi:hypothetical protein